MLDLLSDDRIYAKIQSMTNQKRMGFKTQREKTEFRYSVNFTPSENVRFLTLFEESGVNSKSTFIKTRVFDESFRVIKVDRTLLDYYQKLSSLFAQFRAIGTNYNQLVVALRSNFTEQKAMALLYKLEKLTVELAVIGGEIVELTNEFREKWSQK